ncbi:MAG: alpha/beta hydrolase, partial [Spirochaetota bacterium]
MKNKKSPRVIKGAESYAAWNNSEKAVLCIHGFVGNPCEMRYFASRLESAGFCVNVPRLPGHGTSLEDMLSTGRHDWLL